VESKTARRVVSVTLNKDGFWLKHAIEAFEGETPWASPGETGLPEETGVTTSFGKGMAGNTLRPDPCS